MIYIAGQRVGEVFLQTLNQIPQEIANVMETSNYAYEYQSEGELRFELDMREALVNAAKKLNASDFSFATFRNVRVNEEYWRKTPNGGMMLLENQTAYDGIYDIHTHGRKYATECATAMMIVYFTALSELYNKELYNRVFNNVYLMNWHNIHPLLREVGNVKPYPDYLIGDRRYFDNPEVDPQTPQWQGENVIDLGGGLYYGHGVGIQTADAMIASLNEFREVGATKSAVLLKSAGRPNFKKLYQVLQA